MNSPAFPGRDQGNFPMAIFRFLAAAAAAGALAVPAAAQYYPQQYQYPQQTYPQQGYPQQTYPGYPKQGYGYNQGYANRGYGAANLTFRCNVDYRGAVTNVRVRPTEYSQGY